MVFGQMTEKQPKGPGNISGNIVKILASLIILSAMEK